MGKSHWNWTERREGAGVSHDAKRWERSGLGSKEDPEREGAKTWRCPQRLLVQVHSSSEMSLGILEPVGAVGGCSVSFISFLVYLFLVF
jgi:hypothetical protein